MGGSLLALVALAASPFALLAQPASPEVRDTAVQEACATEVSPDDLDGLLATGRLLSAIDAVRIAECRSDPQLAGWLFTTALLSRVEALPDDPDLGTRAIRGLQALPFEAVSESLATVDPGPVVDGEAQRLARDWLGPLLGVEASSVPPPSPALRAELVEGLGAWSQELLGHGPGGLAALESPGESPAQWAIEDLRSHHLTSLASGEGELGRAAREALSQLGLSEGVRGWPPELRLPLPTLPPVLDVPAATEDRVILRAPGRTPGLRSLALVVLICAAWLLVAQRRPPWRRKLFALAALGLAPLAWVLAESLLALAGAPAPIDERPTFHLGGPSEPGELFHALRIEGQPYLEIDGGSARPVIFAPAPDEGSLRIAVLGESAAYGAGGLAEDSFASVLGRRLTQDMDQPVEVINGGVGGAVSDEILAFTRQLLDTSPDLVVLYLGYNDLEPLARIAEHQAWSPSTMALRALSDRSRVVGALQRLGVSLGSGTAAPDGAFLDERPSTVRERRRVARIVEAMLSDNLTRMVRAARAEGTPVLIGIQGQPATVCRPDSPSGDSCFEASLRRAALRAGERGGAIVVDLPAALEAHRTARSTEAGEWDYYWDAVHPTRLGHRVLGEALAPAAVQLLRESR